MDQPIVVGRRRWLLLGGLGGLAAVAGGAALLLEADDRDAVPDRGRVRTDTAPLQRRFPAVGRLSDAHWLGYDPDGSGRGAIPNPDARVRVVGVARLPAGAVRAITAVPGRAFAPAEQPRIPQELARYLPADARWTASARYDDLVTRSRYPGRFHLDPVTDTVCFDTLDPVPVDGPGAQEGTASVLSGPSPRPSGQAG
ncbi:hypothetical protein [Streptomyces sp. NPDC001380]|uniref:hypothetical protein n=1 Tax=Streptomyces sp. NPDC001380 TaxID=3364566 RepID=UPI0036A0A7CA